MDQRYRSGGMPQRMGASNANIPQSATVDNPGLVAEDWYTYSVLFLAVTPLNSFIGSIQVEADSDFEIIKLTQFAMVADDVAQEESSRVLPLATVLLTDTGSGRNLMNQAVAIPALFGSAELPMILPKPKRLFARATLAVTVQNLSSTIEYSYLQLSFIGKKIFNTGQ